MEKKATKMPPETGASASAHGMREQDVVNEIETTASSSLSEKQNTLMSTFLKNMAAACFIDGIYFSNSAEDQELELGGNLSWKVYLFMVNTPEKVRRVPDDDHYDYDVVASYDMGDMTRVL